MLLIEIICAFSQTNKHKIITQCQWSLCYCTQPSSWLDLHVTCCTSSPNCWLKRSLDAQIIPGPIYSLSTWTKIILHVLHWHFDLGLEKSSCNQSCTAISLHAAHPLSSWSAECLGKWEYIYIIKATSYKWTSMNQTVSMNLFYFCRVNGQKVQSLQ